MSRRYKRGADRLPGLGTYVTFENVFGQQARHADLLNYMEQLPETALRFFCGTSAILHNTPYEARRNLQFGIVNELGANVPYARVIRDILQRDPDAVFLNDEQLAVLFKYALLHAKATEWPSDGPDLLLRLLLVYNSLKGKEHQPKHGDLDAFMKFEIRSVFNFEEHLGFVIDRYAEFFKWSRGYTARNSKNYLDLDTDFREMYGFTYEEWAAAAFAFLSHFRMIRSAKAFEQHDPILNVDGYLAQMHDPAPMKEWLRLNSVDIDQARQQFRDQESASPIYSGVSLSPFLRNPLLRITNSLVCCPYIPYLENSLGSGIFFALLDGYNRRDGTRKTSDRFTRFFGEFFEDYIVNIARRMHPTPERVFREQKQYERGKHSTDLVMFEDDAGLFVDITASRFNYARTLVTLDQSAIEKDIEKIVANAEQLDKSIRAFRAGRLRFAGIEQSDVKRIYPVILTIQQIPRGFAFNRRILEEIERRQLLRDTEHVEILTAEDFEGLEPLYSGGVRLLDVLQRKFAYPHPMAQNTSLKNYLILFDPTTHRKAQKPAHYANSSRWIDTISEIVKNWMEVG